MWQRGVVLLCILAAFVVDVSGLTYEEDATITPQEYKALERFKKLVLPKVTPGTLAAKWSKDDLYLMRFLRAKNLDVRAAETMFTDMLKWREQEKMDTIDKEDWSWIIKDMPIFPTGAFDKTGRPVGELWMADWQTRTLVLAGKSKLAQRWLAHLFEMHCRQVFDLRAEGKNVSQALILVELGSFTLTEQGCPSCLPVYVAVTAILDSYYPNIWESINFINMPSSFDIVIRLVKPVMRPTTRRSMRSYVTEAHWGPYLDANIDKSMRSQRYGGTRNIDPEKYLS